MSFGTMVIISAGISFAVTLATVAVLMAIFTPQEELCERCKAREEDGTDEPILFLLGPTDYSESRRDQTERSH